MKELRDGNKKTEVQLSEIDKTLKDNKKTNEDFITKKDALLNQLKINLTQAQSKVSQLTTTVKGLEGEVNTLTE